MEIVAEGVGVTGAHGPVLLPTSLRVSTGQLLLATGDPNSGRTALALALSGRLRPTQGRVRLDGSADPNALRRRVVVVDAPAITEPESTISVRDAVAEGLSIAGRPSRRSKVRSWLAEHDLRDHSTDRFENLPALDRTRLLLNLATENDEADALVLDCPDRHGGDPLGWYSLALREAERGMAVIVLCSPHSAELLGVEHVHVGADNRAESTIHQMSTMDQPLNHSKGVR